MKLTFFDHDIKMKRLPHDWDNLQLGDVVFYMYYKDTKPMIRADLIIYKDTVNFRGHNNKYAVHPKKSINEYMNYDDDYPNCVINSSSIEELLKLYPNCDKRFIQLLGRGGVKGVYEIMNLEDIDYNDIKMHLQKT